MNESIFKKIWNYSITVGQMIMTAIAMAIVTVIVWLLCRAGSPPRGRGKVLAGCVPLLDKGITPAWAGKSICRKFGGTVF